MKINPVIYTELVDKQFEILGEKIRFKDIPEDGLVEYGNKGKKDMWYNVYRLTDEQEKKWKEWMKEKLKSRINIDKIILDLDLRYGFPISYKKEGQLF